MLSDCEGVRLISACWMTWEGEGCTRTVLTETRKIAAMRTFIICIINLQISNRISIQKNKPSSTVGP